MTMKAAALRGSSTIAIGRSMRRAVLPCLVAICGMTIVPENQLSAYGAVKSGAHLAELVRAPSTDRRPLRQITAPPQFKDRTPILHDGQVSLQATFLGSDQGHQTKLGTSQGVPVPPAPGGQLTYLPMEAILASKRDKALSQGSSLTKLASHDAELLTDMPGVKLRVPTGMDTSGAPFSELATGHAREIGTPIAPEFETSSQAGLTSVLAANGPTDPTGSGFGLPASEGLTSARSHPAEVEYLSFGAVGELVEPVAAADEQQSWGPSLEASRTFDAETVIAAPAPGLGVEVVALPALAVPELPSPSVGRDVAADSLIDALPEFRPLAQEMGLPTARDASDLDDWQDESKASSFALVSTGEPGAEDAVIDQDGVTLVKIGALVEMLSGQFDIDELERIRSSDARLHYLSIDALQHAGIPVSYDRDKEALRLDTHFVQDNGGAQAGTGASDEGDSGSSGSIGNQSLVATASVGFDSNPFLSDADSPEAVSVRLQLNPSITRSDGRSSFRASGRVEHIEYLGNYGSLQNFGADLSGLHKLNERLEANFAALFRSDILATDLTNPLSTGEGLDPGIPVVPGGNDVTILGQRQRRTQYGADTGLTFRPSERDEVRWGFAWRSDRFGSDSLSDSDFFSQQLRYSRQVNGDLAVGAIVDASIIDFTNGTFGDAQTLTPQALVVLSLSERLKATGSLGFALTRVETPAGNETTRAVAGNLALCYEGERSNLCLNGARQVLPSAIGGARVQTTAGLSYSLRLSERESLQLGGNYSTASQPLAALGNEFESINAFARYERRLNERAQFFVSGGYLDTSGNTAFDATNVQAVMGITIRLGSGR